MREFVIWAGWILGGFLIGSVLFSKIVPKLLCHVDVCANSPDHNPGAANVFAACGIGIGLFALVLDMMKGFLPVFAALHFVNPQNMLFALVMFAPVLGHAVGLFNRFHGGKCIATAFGVEIALLGVTRVGLILAGLYILFSTMVKIRPNRVRSMVTFALFGAAAGMISVLNGQYAIAIGNILISAAAVVKHLRVFSEIFSKEPEEALLEDSEAELSLADADETTQLP